MLGEDCGLRARDAEAEFRERLATKLQARGYDGAELERKIDELLRKGVNLQLEVQSILGAS